MPEYINREAVSLEIGNVPPRERNYRKAMDIVDTFPAADVVEVVRCRECKYRDYDDEPYGKKVAVCTGAMAYSNTPDDWYCPMGKRKDGGQDDD